MKATKIDHGTQSTAGETVLWRGAPTLGGFARDVFHVRILLGYLALLWAADLFQIWRQALPLGQALHNSVPLLAISVAASALVVTLVWFSARTTRYVVTDRRIVLHYGIAMSATLSLPFGQVVAAAASSRKDGSGDVALTLREGNRMPYLKLWPLARPWKVSTPQPMLRCIPDAETVGALVAQALQTAHDRRALAESVALVSTPASDEVAAARRAA